MKWFSFFKKAMPDKAPDWVNVEMDIQKGHNKMMQLMEDQQWERDINTEAMRFIMSDDIMLVPNFGKAVYMMHDEETAKYKDNTHFTDHVSKEIERIRKENPELFEGRDILLKMKYPFMFK